MCELSQTQKGLDQSPQGKNQLCPPAREGVRSCSHNTPSDLKPPRQLNQPGELWVGVKHSDNSRGQWMCHWEGMTFLKYRINTPVDRFPLLPLISSQGQIWESQNREKSRPRRREGAHPVRDSRTPDLTLLSGFPQPHTCEYPEQAVPRAASKDTTGLRGHSYFKILTVCQGESLVP